MGPMTSQVCWESVNHVYFTTRLWNPFLLLLAHAWKSAINIPHGKHQHYVVKRKYSFWFQSRYGRYNQIELRIVISSKYNSNLLSLLSHHPETWHEHWNRRLHQRRTRNVDSIRYTPRWWWYKGHHQPW